MALIGDILWAWGTRGRRRSPPVIVWLPGVATRWGCRPTALAAGAVHTLGWRDDGTVLATGEESHGQLQVGDWRLR